tara:strand:+ start:3092 stop:3403 length:312 start_codon:yes stop_codon:yes gene_type:complete
VDDPRACVSATRARSCIGAFVRAFGRHPTRRRGGDDADEVDGDDGDRLAGDDADADEDADEDGGRWRRRTSRDDATGARRPRRDDDDDEIVGVARDGARQGGR